MTIPRFCRFGENNFQIISDSLLMRWIIITHDTPVSTECQQCFCQEVKVDVGRHFDSNNDSELPKQIKFDYICPYIFSSRTEVEYYFPNSCSIFKSSKKLS